MDSPAILGLSFSTRNQGLAVVKLNLLVDYSLKLYKGKWSLQKKELILTSLATCIESYNIQKLALSIPSKCHQTEWCKELLTSILALAKMYSITVIEYSTKELLLLIPNSTKRPKKGLMKRLVELFPELITYYKKELNNKHKYYIKMFEAIAAATLYSHKIGRWKG